MISQNIKDRDGATFYEILKQRTSHLMLLENFTSGKAPTWTATVSIVVASLIQSPREESLRISSKIPPPISRYGLDSPFCTASLNIFPYHDTNTRDYCATSTGRGVYYYIPKAKARSPIP